MTIIAFLLIAHKQHQSDTCVDFFLQWLSLIHILAVPDTITVKPGDKVVLLGSQGHESISALEIAALASTIPYEIFCGFSERVPRQYI